MQGDNPTFRESPSLDADGARQSAMDALDQQSSLFAQLAPVADFFSTKHEDNPPFSIQFVNSFQGEYTSSQWDFGDGCTIEMYGGSKNLVTMAAILRGWLNFVKVDSSWYNRMRKLNCDS